LLKKLIAANIDERDLFTSSFLLKKLIAANIDECSRSKVKALFVDRIIP
jgi:hypothetical protein